MGPEDHRVSRLDGHDALEQHGGRGIGDGRDRKDQADRFRHFHQAAFRKFANHADARFVPDVVVYEFRGHHVLDGLVLENPQFGFLDRQAREILGLCESGQDHRFDNAIDVLLGELRKEGGGGLALPHQSFQVRDAVVTEGCKFLFHALRPDRIIFRSA